MVTKLSHFTSKLPISINQKSIPRLSVYTLSALVALTLIKGLYEILRSHPIKCQHFTSPLSSDADLKTKLTSIFSVVYPLTLGMKAFLSPYRLSDLETKSMKEEEVQKLPINRLSVDYLNVVASRPEILHSMAVSQLTSMLCWENFSKRPTFSMNTFVLLLAPEQVINILRSLPPPNSFMTDEALAKLSQEDKNKRELSAKMHSQINQLTEENIQRIFNACKTPEEKGLFLAHLDTDKQKDYLRQIGMDQLQQLAPHLILSSLFHVFYEAPALRETIIKFATAEQITELAIECYIDLKWYPSLLEKCDKTAFQEMANQIRNRITRLKEVDSQLINCVISNLIGEQIALFIQEAKGPKDITNYLGAFFQALKPRQVQWLSEWCCITNNTARQKLIEILKRLDHSHLYSLIEASGYLNFKLGTDTHRQLKGFFIDILGSEETLELLIAQKPRMKEVPDDHAPQPQSSWASDYAQRATIASQAPANYPPDYVAKTQELRARWQNNSLECYQLLGFNTLPKEEVLKSAYKKLVVLLHPDKNQGHQKQEAEEFFKLIQAANKHTKELIDKSK